MKIIIYTLCTLFIATASFAQVNIKFGINHNLGSDYVKPGQTGTNNLPNSFNLSRLEYYISQISISHDGGKKTEMKDVYILANAFSPQITDLGKYEIESVESITFSIGVDTPINNDDPAQHPTGHPLAPKSPSMHWGWAAGYRFVAMEGQTGDNMNTHFEIHALGNVNYFSTTVATTAKNVNGDVVIALNADYTQALQDIDISQGPTTHGESDEAADLLKNFRDHVFSSADGTVGLDKNIQKPALQLYPNPSNIQGVFVKLADNNTQAITYKVYDMMGKEQGLNITTTSTETFVPITKSGIYFLVASNSKGILSKNKVVIQ